MRWRSRRSNSAIATEQLHATELARRRSRAAAKARAARISSRVRSGKSLRIASSVIPPARYSSTSYTVMRVPLIQGFPLRTAGFTETRSCHAMVKFVPPSVLGGALSATTSSSRRGEGRVSVLLHVFHGQVEKHAIRLQKAVHLASRLDAE